MIHNKLNLGQIYIRVHSFIHKYLPIFILFQRIQVHYLILLLIVIVPILLELLLGVEVLKIRLTLAVLT